VQQGNGVAGEAAALYDVSSASNHDLIHIFPIAILAIGLLLAVVLRSLVATRVSLAALGFPRGAEAPPLHRIRSVRQRPVTTRNFVPGRRSEYAFSVSGWTTRRCAAGCTKLELGIWPPSDPKAVSFDHRCRSLLGTLPRTHCAVFRTQVPLWLSPNARGLSSRMTSSGVGETGGDQDLQHFTDRLFSADGFS